MYVCAYVLCLALLQTTVDPPARFTLRTFELNHLWLKSSETTMRRDRCHLNMLYWLSVNGVDVCWLPGCNGPEWKLSVLTLARILPLWTLVMFIDVATRALIVDASPSWLSFFLPNKFYMVAISHRRSAKAAHRCYFH